MDDSSMQTLLNSIDTSVRIICTDGEILVAKLIGVYPEEEELVYDIISTTDQSKYEKYDQQPSYLMQFRDIVRVEAI